MINIDNLIKDVLVNNRDALNAYKLLKASFIKWKKDNPGKEFNEVIEAKLVKKMYDQTMESARIYKEAGRDDLAEAELKEANVIKPLLPKEASEEEIIEITEHIIKSSYPHGVTMKDTKLILSKVQDSYPNASGKLISSIVKNYASKS